MTPERILTALSSLSGYSRQYTDRRIRRLVYSHLFVHPGAKARIVDRMTIEERLKRLSPLDREKVWLYILGQRWDQP